MAERYLAVTGGSNSNAGTEASPWATMAFAVTQLAAGDTLYCRQGTHGEINIAATVNAGTSWTNAITVRSYPGETATLPRIRLNHTSIAYWIFTDLVLNGGGAQANLFDVQTGVDFVRLSSCIVTNATGSLVFLNSSSGGNCEILGNQIHNTSSGSGILCRTANNRLEGNTIYDVPDHGIDARLAASTGVNNNSIQRNYVYSTGNTAADVGIIVGNGSGNILAYNVIAECTGDGMQLDVDGSNTGVYNNTIYSCVGNGIEILATNDGGNILRNNILYSNGGTIVDGRGDATADHNLTTDPTFVDAAAGNFALQSSSAARNAGVAIAGLTIDFLGHPVPQGSAPDIGAFEFEEVAVTDVLPDPVEMVFLFPAYALTFSPTLTPEAVGATFTVANPDVFGASVASGGWAPFVRRRRRG